MLGILQVVCSHAGDGEEFTVKCLRGGRELVILEFHIFYHLYKKKNDQYHIRSTCKQNVAGVHYGQTKPKQSPSELCLLLSLVKVK